MRMVRKRVRRVLPPLDYKDTDALSKYLTEKGKILPRRITRLNAKDQRTLKRLIKRARHAGLISFQAI
ncbi:MAG TPA: 30S ribosomal protein S18 [Candidatus Omnitrophota bacterium]|nr:30S ribosomal protein S18 [Candidatus Omnitrophota bacterium]HPW65008.1 30S ribosomal protein S18 [Candidatus Omnitrophota bacterium]HQB93600.1 30S ribosomal protein S18 [Candidatus Omnitrophota bacterium]